MGESERGPVDDAWSMKIPEFKPEDNPHSLLEESSFSILFPKYREEYIKECWPLVENTLGGHYIKAELDLIEGSMTVRTTRKTWDPYIIIKARDLIKLLSRSVPFEHATKVLEDENGSEIIKIGSMVRNKEKFIKRRKRLLGPAGCTLKSIELLTDCYVQVQGQTVAVVGPYKGLIQVRRIVEDTMRNIHPVYNVKALMIKRELAKDPKLKNEDWSRFLPKFERKTVNKKKKVKPKKKDTSLLPPLPTESKIDKMLASGEYFLRDDEKIKRKKDERDKRHVEKEKERQERRNLPFQPPKEDAPSTSKANQSNEVNLDNLKKKVAKSKKSFSSQPEFNQKIKKERK